MGLLGFAAALPAARVDDRIQAGAGGRVTLTSALDLCGFDLRTLEGSNTHSGSGFGLGLTWLFGARQ